MSNTNYFSFTKEESLHFIHAKRAYTHKEHTGKHEVTQANEGL